MYFHLLYQHWEPLVQTSHDNTFGKKSIQIQTTQFPGLFVSYREGFSIDTGKAKIVADKEPLFIQN